MSSKLNPNSNSDLNFILKCLREGKIWKKSNLLLTAKNIKYKSPVTQLSVIPHLSPSFQVLWLLLNSKQLIWREKKGKRKKFLATSYYQSPSKCCTDSPNSINWYTCRGRGTEKVQQAGSFWYFHSWRDLAISIYCEFTRVRLEKDSCYTEVPDTINRNRETGPVCMRTQTVEVMGVNEKRSIY